MKGDPPECRLSEVTFYILFHVGWLSKWWKTQGLFARSLRFLSLPRSLREIYLLFNEKFRSNSLNTYTNIHKQLNIQTALTSCVKSPLSLFFLSCSRSPPPFLIWEPVSCSTPALEFFPMSVHTSNTSWQAQRSLLRIIIPNNYSISYTLADLFTEHYA